MARDSSQATAKCPERATGSTIPTKTQSFSILHGMARQFLRLLEIVLQRLHRAPPALETIDGEAVGLSQLLLQHANAVRRQVHRV